MSLPAVFTRYRDAIDRELRQSLQPRHSPLYDMLRYHLGWIDADGRPCSTSSGKALRPTLCLLACQATDTPAERALPAAATVELVHNFSLIHDDIQDDDRERRHRPTVWSIWGKPQAINAGTAMHIVASLELRRLLDQGIPAEKFLRAQSLVEDSCLRLIEGQYLDINFESRLDIDVADYLSMIEGKTARLLACSTELGALVGSDDARVVEALHNYGRHLGLAFQIRDDVLGIWGDERKTGKVVGSDILRKKKSFPIVYALQHAAPDAKATLVEIYGRPAVEDAARVAVLEVLGETGAQAAAQAVVEQYHQKSIAAIAGVGLVPSAHSELVEVAEFLVSREF